MNQKEVQILVKAKRIAQHRPWWEALFPMIAQKRSLTARHEWTLYCKSLIMQAKNFEDAWFVLCESPSSGDARDACIIIAANFAKRLEDINMVSAKAGFNSKYEQLITTARSAILDS